MDFSKHIQKADEALRRRNYDFAIGVFRELLDIDPDIAEARSGLRQAYRKKFEAKRGGKLLRVLGGAVPLASAKTLLKAKKYGAATKQLESYLGQNPLDEEGNLLLGMALEDAGHFNSARVVYEFVAEIAPKNPDGLKRAGAMMFRTGDPQRALEYYERALEADPRDQEALKARKNLAAETALASGSFNEVAHSRERIVDKEAQMQRERSHRRHKSADDLKQELEHLEARFAEQSSDPDLMMEIASVHERLRDFDAALELLERASSYRKDSFDLRSRIGEVRGKVLKKRIARADKLGDAEGAAAAERELWEHEIEDFEQRVSMRPGDAELRIQLGRRLARAERLDEALAQFQKAQLDSRVKGDAVFHLAQCFQRKGFPDLARTEYVRALEGVSDGDERAKEILYNLGSIAEEQDAREEAKSYFGRVFKVDIGYRDVATKMEQFR